MKRAKATRDGTCDKCKGPYQRGDRVFWMTAVHEGCFRGGFSAIPPAPTLEFTRLRAMDAMEESIHVAAKIHGVTDEVEKLWERYEQLKSSALRPGSAQEEKTAFRKALIQLVTIAFM